MGRIAGQLVVCILIVVLAVILCAETVSGFKTHALDSEYYWYQYKADVVTWRGNDMAELDILFQSATIEQLNAADYGIAPEVWQAYQATWFYGSQVTHWFQIRDQCYLLTFDNPHLYQPTNAVLADCAILTAFHEDVMHTMIDAIRPDAEATSEPDI